MERTPWWRHFRKRRYKPKGYYSTEMILRKSILDTANDYLKNCSVSGVQTICDSGISLKKRVLWIAVICTAFVFVCHYTTTFIHNGYSKPFTVTVKSFTYPIWNIDFPAVALCNVNRISKMALEKQAVITYSNLKGNVKINEIKLYYLAMGNLINFRKDKNPAYKQSLDILNSWIKTNVNITDLMEEMAPNCSNMLVKCSWAGKITDCSTMFHIRRTFLGHCCVFNYVLDYNSADRPSKGTESIMRQNVPGPEFGLAIIVDPQLDDYAYPLEPRTGVEVFMFEPTHYLDPMGGRVIQKFGQVNQANIFHIESIKQEASPAIRIYPHTYRRCLFKEDYKSDFHDMYSYSACLVRCRLQSIYSLCKCIPFFMPTALFKNNRTCSIRDLRCLNKYREKFLHLYPHDTDNTHGLEVEKVDSIYCPDCLPDCELTRHYIKSFTVSKKDNEDKEFRNNFLNGVNLTKKCYISIYQTDPSGILHSLELVAQWYEMVANFGGFAGMLMGLGAFSFFELTYFLFIRLVQIFHSNYIKYH